LVGRAATTTTTTTSPSSSPSSRAALLVLAWLLAHSKFFQRVLKSYQLPLHYLHWLPPYPQVSCF
jgi:hypothetical protein